MENSLDFLQRKQREFFDGMNDEEQHLAVIEDSTIAEWMDVYCEERGIK